MLGHSDVDSPRKEKETYMEIDVFCTDMKPEFKRKWLEGELALSTIRFHMFKPHVQAAIEDAECATFRDGNRYERINPPQETMYPHSYQIVSPEKCPAIPPEGILEAEKQLLDGDIIEMHKQVFKVVYGSPRYWVRLEAVDEGTPALEAIFLRE
jgi:hypothetical protein